MEVKVGLNPKDLSKIPRDQRRQYKRKYKRALSKVAQIGINIIQERTERGVSFKGGNFAPYTEKYAEFRSKKGRQLRPNLMFSGRMLGAMTSRANYRRAEIFFRGKTESRKASANNEKRPFFGFNRQETERLAKAFERFIQ